MGKVFRILHRAIPVALLLGAVTHAATIGTVAINPNATPAGVAATVVATARITDAGVIASSVNLQKIDAQGRVLAVIGEMRDDGTGGDTAANDRTFTIRFTVYDEKPGSLTFRASAGFLGSLVRVNSSPLAFSVTGAFATGVTISQPANLVFVNTGSITVIGTAGDPGATVRVNGIQAAKNGNGFQTSVPLQEGNNTITAVATNSNASTSSASIQVTLDTTPPRVTVDSPANGFTTTETALTVTGIVNDIVVGTVNSLQAQVTVNSLNAVVANRTYTAANVPLQLGVNNIQVIGRDQTGNSATVSISVTRQAITQPFIKLISGNNQSGVIGSALPAPLVVQLLNGVTPVPNTPVVFKITENDGFLQPGLGKPQTIIINTNLQGQAQALFTLGNRSGAGNNTVEAYAGSFQGTAAFVASGTPKPAAKINVDSGNNQFGAVNQSLALPFVAVVTDAGNNRLGGVQVTFAVRQGAGLINGLASVQTVTDGDGRALAILTLGSQPGQDNNVIEATFAGNPGFPAAFSATGKIPGNPNLTSISGVVLDNSNGPIPNVTMRVYQTNQGINNNQHLQIGTPVPTDARGLFKILPAPVGFFKLMADGTTATQNGKQYPTLEYDLVTVAGQDNTVGSPIYLPQLDPLATVCVNATTGGVLKVSSSPGFSLTIQPGSATFPGGSKTGCVSVTPVNPDKIPMVPGFGQQPRYVVTIQPVGTIFNPPAAITIPNMDGLAPNAKTEMYSFDHDLAAFVAIGSATVSVDGSIIASDPGVGVLKAGWHCGGDPNVPGSAASLAVTLAAPAGPNIAGATVDLVASGSPPLDGEYVNWQIIDDPADPNDDPTVGQLTATPGCPNQVQCVGKLRGAKFGVVTVRVSFRCTTTGQVVQSNLVKVRFDIGLTIKEISFLSDIDLTRDKNGTLEPLNDPVWKSTNAATDNGEVAYVRNRKIRVSAKFEISPALPSAISGITIEAEIPGLGKVQVTNQTLSGNSYDFPATDSDNALPNETKVSTGQVFNWRAARDGSVQYVTAGSSANTIYSTLDTPRAYAKLAGGRVAVTLLKLGIGSGGATDVPTALAKTWASFSGPANITTWDSRRMYYYKAGVGFDVCALDYVTLIQTNPESGQCGSFAKLLLGSLAVNNVPANWVQISVVDGDQMIVKNWTFAAGTYPAAAAYKWKYETNTPDPMVPDLPGSVYGDLTNDNGLTGQNSPKPSEKLFGFHFIVKASSGYYDPSYGVTYTGDRGFETSALEGYAGNFGDGTRTAGGITYRILRARKVDATTNIAFADGFSN